MDKTTILVIEDEPTILEFLRTGLKYEGYDVIIASDGKQAREYLSKEKSRGEKADLIILDLMLPDTDGLTICKNLRASGDARPIIILTAKTEVQERVKGLDTGADDYITKPFSFEELLARIRVQLRKRGKTSEKTILTAEDIVLNTETKEVTRGGKQLHLTPAEFSLLELFMRYPKRVFSRDTLLNRIFGYDYISDTNIIDVHISHLREKLNDKPPKLIKTIYGSGYSFQPEEGKSDKYSSK